MVRTQIYLPEEEHRELLFTARRENISMAELIRKYIHIAKQRKGVDRSGKKALAAIMRIKARGGPKDLSANHDHYLYGGPKK